jgi:hypothetical protein
MIGGEGEENPIWMSNGAWIDNAQLFVNTIFKLFKFGTKRSSTLTQIRFKECIVCFSRA